jgi:CubicO group peptidase (beta-lactamase class C family)
MNASLHVRRLLAIGIAVCIAASLAPASTQLPAGPEDLKTVADTAAAQALAKPGSAGLSIAIGQRGSVVLATGYGFRNLATHEPVEPGTIFHACSISKQFAAAGILRLSERSLLSLDDPVTKHLPGFHTRGRAMNLWHLLNHTSGLPSYDRLPAFAGENEIHDLPHARIIEMFQDEPCKFAPGDVFAYTNSGFFLAGEIIERVSGKSWGDFLHDEFTGPLGLKDTSYDPHPPPELESRIAIGYTLEGDKMVEARKIAWANASCAGGNLTTARDLVMWSMALSSGGVVSPASYAAMTTPTTWPDGDCSGYGLGLWVDPDQIGGGEGRIWHTGHGDGYTAALASFPHAELVIAVMSSSDKVESMDILNTIATGVLKTPERKANDLPLPGDRIHEFVGTYQQPRSHESVVVGERDGRLTAKPGGLPTFTLLWQGEDRFVLREDPRVEIQFNRSPDGSGHEPCRALVRIAGGIRETAVRQD